MRSTDRKWTIALVLALVSVMLGLISAAQAGEGPPRLFTDESVVPGDVRSEQPPQVRSRYVRVAREVLFDTTGAPRQRDELSRLTLNLFPGVSYTGVVTDVKDNGDSVSWTGRIQENSGYFYLVSVDDVFVVHVASSEGIYEVSLADGDVYRVVELDQSQLGEDAPGGSEAPTSDPEPADADRAGGSPENLDVLVLYTDDARAAEGGTSAMRARIALAMTETNASYANAAINPRLRLVHAEEIAYAETGNIVTDVNRLVHTSDGHLDAAHSLRDAHGADMVALIVEDGGGFCGIAAAIMATAATAFQVTVRNGCMTGNYTFGHEFGHLQGARHDKYVDNTNTPYAHGHGYVHKGSVASQRWRTVMAYNNECADAGYFCTRLQYWSNSKKKYNTAAMGVKNASENYRVVNDTAPQVAQFRSSVAGSGFSSSFNGSSAGWSAVTGTWKLTKAKTNYYSSSGLAGNAASAKYADVYGDLAFEVKMRRTGCTYCANRVIVRGNPGNLASFNRWAPSYVFQYTNGGSFSVWKNTAAGDDLPLKDWTASSAIANGGWNTLKVIAVDESLTFYINGQAMWTGSDSALQTGQVGFGFFRDAAAGVLAVDYAQLTLARAADGDTTLDIPQAGSAGEGGDIDHSP
jgi:hypothetical protein